MKKLWFRLTGVFLILFIACGISAEGYFKLTEPETYKVHLSWEFKNQGGQARNLNIRLHLPNRDDLPPYQKMLSYSLYPSGNNAKVDGEFTELNFPLLGSRSTLKIQCDFTVMNYAIVYNLDAYVGGQYTTETRYLEPEAGIESTAPAIVDLAKKITEGKAGNLGKAKSIFAFLNSHLEYRYFKEETHSALTTLSRRYGSCTDYSYAFIALCRAVGVPARLVRGYRFDPAKIGGQPLVLDDLGHAWAEIQLPLIGWITVDPTYNYLVNGVKEINYDFFGKVIPQDRHLFLGYTLDSDCQYFLEHSRQNPSKIEIQTTGTIQRVR